VVATANAYNKVTLTWTASTDNKAIAGYYIVRNGVTLATTTTTSYVDNSVTANTSYNYAVIAYDAAGNTATSSTVSAKTPVVPDTTAPSVPQTLTAQVISSTQINLTWAPSTDNTGVANYKIYRGSSSIATLSSTLATSYGDASLSASTAYTYTVVACDATNNCSAQSIPVTATTQAAPVAQTIGSLSGTVKDQSGSAISRVRIKVVNSTNTYSTSTSSQGTYSYSQLPQGNYSATYSRRSYTPVQSTITITGGKLTVNNVTLAK
jgi:cellulose 1,4-beta-cellobiosidase